MARYLRPTGKALAVSATFAPRGSRKGVMLAQSLTMLRHQSKMARDDGAGGRLKAYQRTRNQHRKMAAIGKGPAGGIKHRPAGSPRGGQFY